MKVSVDVLESHQLKNPYACPADPSSDLYQSTERFWIGYGWGVRGYYGKNDVLGRYYTDTGNFKLRNSVKSPALTVMVMDGWGSGLSYAEIKWKARHAGRVNILFTDGHTESLPVEKIIATPSAYNTPFWNPDL